MSIFQTSGEKNERKKKKNKYNFKRKENRKERKGKMKPTERYINRKQKIKR